MSDKLKRCTKEAFDAFVAAYPRALTKHLVTITEPPLMQLCDFTLGKEPKDFVVASYLTAGGDPKDIWANVPCGWSIRTSLQEQEK